MNEQTILGKTSEKPLLPSELNLMAKEKIESEISRVWVSGEVSDFYQAPSGHS